MWHGLPKVEDLFKCLTRFQVTNGGVGFWNDLWCSISLSRLFPSLYNLSSTKTSRVADNWNEGTGIQSSWFLGFDETTWEEKPLEVNTMMGLLRVSPNSEQQDILVWNDGSDNCNVRQCYWKILNLRL